jgi:hypothetical protein
MTITNDKTEFTIGNCGQSINLSIKRNFDGCSMVIDSDTAKSLYEFLGSILQNDKNVISIEDSAPLKRAC